MTEYLTTAEAARAFRCSPDLIRRMCERGELRHIRIGRQYRIPADATDVPDEKPRKLAESKRVRDEIELACIRLGLNPQDFVTP